MQRDIETQLLHASQMHVVFAECSNVMRFYDLASLRILRWTHIITLALDRTCLDLTQTKFDEILFLFNSMHNNFERRFISPFSATFRQPKKTGATL